MRLERLVKGGFVRHINPHYCYYYYYPGNNQESILAYMDYINELFFSYWNTFTIFNGSAQLAKMKKGIPDMSLP